MADINLIKAVVEEKTKRRRESTRTASVVVIFVLLLVVITVLVLGGRLLLAQQNKSLDSQITVAESAAEEVGEIENNINSLNSDYSKIKAVDKTSRNWPEIFAKIAAATPADIQLTKIDFVGSTSAAATKKVAQENKLKISGDARTRRAVSLFQKKLQHNTDIFSSVEIIKTGTTSKDDVSIITFEIEAVFKKI